MENKTIRVTLKNGKSFIMDQHYYTILSSTGDFRVYGGYAYHLTSGEQCSLGRIIYQLHHNCKLPRSQKIGYKNGKSLDLRISNLELFSAATHQWRSRRVNRFGLRGVCQRSGQSSYSAQISYNAIDISLGSYKNKYVAALAYNIAASALFGELSQLNQLPDEIAKFATEGFKNRVLEYVTVKATIEFKDVTTA